MSRPSVPHYCPNCHQRVLLSPEAADDAPMVGTAEGAQIAGVAQRTLSKWCLEGAIPGAWREGGYQARWEVPRAWCEEYAENRLRDQHDRQFKNN